MNFNDYEVVDYEDKKHKLCSAKLAPVGGIYCNKSKGNTAKQYR